MNEWKKTYLIPRDQIYPPTVDIGQRSLAARRMTLHGAPNPDPLLLVSWQLAAYSLISFANGSMKVRWAMDGWLSLSCTSASVLRGPPALGMSQKDQPWLQARSLKELLYQSNTATTIGACLIIGGQKGWRHINSGLSLYLRRLIWRLGPCNTFSFFCITRDRPSLNLSFSTEQGEEQIVLLKANLCLLSGPVCLSWKGSTDWVWICSFFFGRVPIKGQAPYPKCRRIIWHLWM